MSPFLNHESVGKSLPLILKERAESEPQGDALVFLFEDRPAKTVSNSQLLVDSLRYAQALHQMGIKPNDLVMLVFSHSYELVTAFWGAICLGAVPAIFPYFNPKSDLQIYKERVKRLVTVSEAQAVLTIPQFKEDLALLLADTSSRVLDIQDVPLSAPHRLLATRGGEDIAFLQFSSGTTGLPKGVMLSHDAVFNNISSMAASMQFSKQDVSITWAPFYHEMGLLLGFLMPLLIYGKAILISPFHWIRRPEVFLWAIHDYKGTMGWMPNFGYNVSMRRIPDEALVGLDLSSLRIMGNGSEPVRHETIERFNQHFAPYGFRKEMTLAAYGMAENVVLITVTPPGEAPVTDWVSAQAMRESKRAMEAPPHTVGSLPIVSCGIPIEQAEIDIVDEEGKRLPERLLGEVIIRTNSLFTSYYRRPDLTAQALRDGSFYTGDIGYIADGELYICERKKDLIIIAGQNISPNDIEAITQRIMGSDAARSVAFGIPNEELGTEMPVLVCEVRRRYNESEQEALSHQIRYQVLQELNVTLADVRLVKKGWIERTTSGKTSRFANRQKYLTSGYAALPSVSLADERQKVEQFISQQHTKSERRAFLVDLVDAQVAALLGARAATGNRSQSLIQQGIDSLRAVELARRLSDTLGCAVGTSVVFDYPTVEEIVDYLAEKIFPTTVAPRQQAEPNAELDHELAQLLAEIEQISAHEALELLAL